MGVSRRPVDGVRLPLMSSFPGPNLPVYKPVTSLGQVLLGLCSLCLLHMVVTSTYSAVTNDPKNLNSGVSKIQIKWTSLLGIEQNHVCWSHSSFMPLWEVSTGIEAIASHMMGKHPAAKLCAQMPSPETATSSFYPE